MRVAKNLNKHVFCLEGDWEDDLRDKSSVTASLDFLQQNCGINYIHKHCGTKENLQYYLKLWKNKRYKDYTIAYFAFHGHPEQIKIGKEYLDLEQLAEILNGSCVNKIIHFGCCQKSIRKFLDTTHALAVCGFRTEIDFLEGSIFDMLLLQRMQEYKDMSALDRYMKRNYRRLINNLDFRLHYN
jgi:hypothetical protein